MKNNKIHKGGQESSYIKELRRICRVLGNQEWENLNTIELNNYIDGELKKYCEEKKRNVDIYEMMLEIKLDKLRWYRLSNVYMMGSEIEVKMLDREYYREDMNGSEDRE